MTVTEFRRVFADLPQGWLTEIEALLLVDWAGRTTGLIVEIGSYYGRSTALLASLPGQRIVQVVDPWADCGDFKYGPGVTGDEVYNSFLMTCNFLPVIATRCRVEEWNPCPAGFVYCDGDHTYAGTRTQIEKALACNPMIIAAHDVNDTGGGVDVKRACLELLGPWTERVERLAVWDLRSKK